MTPMSASKIVRKMHYDYSLIYGTIKEPAVIRASTFLFRLKVMHESRHPEAEEVKDDDGDEEDGRLVGGETASSSLPLIHKMSAAAATKRDTFRRR